MNPMMKMLGMGAEQEPETNEHDQEQLEKERDAALQKVWVARIEAEERTHKDFRERGVKIEKVYNEGKNKVGNSNLDVPLWWSTVQIEHSGVYSSQPSPDIRPNSSEQSEPHKEAALVLERGISYYVDKQSFDDCFHRSVDDYLNVGLGVARIKLESEIVEIPGEPMMDQFGQQTEGKSEQAVGNQVMRWAYVPWRRFGWEPCNSWDDCDWIYYRHRMTAAQIKKRFGKTLAASKDEKDSGSTGEWKSTTLDIYEVWDRPNKKVLFIAKGESYPAEVNDDPLGLADFFPSPPPMMTNIPSEELIPQSDYDYIEPYDIEINSLQARRMALVEQVKAAGAYDSSFPELADILNSDDGEMKPVANLAARTQGGIDKTMTFLPIEEKIRVVGVLTEQIQFVKSQVDEILGIADIVRGVSNAKEGVGTQELKGRWVGIRLSRKRDTVQYTVREMFRIMGQVLASHYTDENLQRLTQSQPDPETLNLLRNDLLMDFSLDIESESTVARDEFRERETRTEMMGMLSTYAQGVLPMVQQGLMPADVSSAVLRAALSPYTKYDRSLDESLGSLQTTQDQLGQMSQQLQQMQQQLTEAQQGQQQWQTLAQTLQSMSTEAKTDQQRADAEKKRAETQKTYSEIPDNQIQPQKTVAEIRKLNADTVSTMRG